MTPEQIAKLKKRRWENYVRDTTEAIVRSACGMGKGENYKKYVPLMELINYKTDNNYRYSGTGQDRDTVKFQRFVEVADEIVVEVAQHWPFIDLEGIDLTWSSDQIVHQVIKMYGQIPAITFDGAIPVAKDNTEALARIEQLFREYFKMEDPKKKFNKTEYFSHFAFEALGIVQSPDRAEYQKQYNEANEFVKGFEKILNDEFPDAVISVGTWTKYKDLTASFNKQNQF